MQLGVVCIAATGSWCASSHTAIPANQFKKTKMNLHNPAAVQEIKKHTASALG
jgi:hypothetical protein